MVLNRGPDRLVVSMMKVIVCQVRLSVVLHRGPAGGGHG